MKALTTKPFNLRRLAVLARSHWCANFRLYVMWLVVMTLLAVAILIFLSLSMLENRPIRFTTAHQSTLYFLGLLLSGPVFAAQHFGPMRRTEHALMVLMQPASVFEKWMLAGITVLLGFPLFYTLWFAAIASPVAAFSQWWDLAYLTEMVTNKNRLIPAQTPSSDDYRVFLPGRPSESADLVKLFVYSALTGLAVTGSLLFKRAPFLTTLVLGFLMGLSGVFVGAMANLLGDGNVSATLFRWWTDDPKAQPVVLGVYVVNGAFWLGMPALLWLAAWRCLKERELS